MVRILLQQRRFVVGTRFATGVCRCSSPAVGSGSEVRKTKSARHRNRYGPTPDRSPGRAKADAIIGCGSQPLCGLVLRGAISCAVSRVGQASCLSPLGIGTNCKKSSVEQYESPGKSRGHVDKGGRKFNAAGPETTAGLGMRTGLLTIRKKHPMSSPLEEYPRFARALMYAKRTSQAV